MLSVLYTLSSNNFIPCSAYFLGMRRGYAILLAALFVLMTMHPVIVVGGNRDSIIPPTFSSPRSNMIFEAGPWWETTSMDKTRTKVFDSLEEMMVENETVDIYVSYEHPPTEEDVERLEDRGLNVTHVFNLGKAIGVNGAPSDIIYNLTRLPGVVMVEPKGTGFPLSDVATPASFARPSDLYSPYTAWELGYSGIGVNVAIVDTGIDIAHPSLAGKFVAGVDFSDVSSRPDKPTDGSYNPDDTNGHGTTCAGIATGTGAPEGVYMGSAPGAMLVDVKIGRTLGYNPGEIVLPGQPLPGPGVIIAEDACIAGIEWVAENKNKAWPGIPESNHGIDILSLSWGIDVRGSSDGSDLYSRTLDAAVEAGVFVANAAGNSGPDNDGFAGLSAASLTICVGSSNDQNTITRDDDEIASYSSRGPRADDGDGNPYNELRPDVAAPGTDITQAEFDRMGDGSGGGYGPRGSGTSYAAPVIAGVLALMIEANGNITPLVGREMIRVTAERRDDPTFPDLDPFWNKDWGWGLVDAYRAVRLAELTDNVPEIDPNLQCFIMNRTEGPRGSLVSGISWNRGGNVSAVEYRIGDGPWRRAQPGAEDNWDNWNFFIPVAETPVSNSTVQVRAVDGDMYSLVDWFEIEGQPLVEKLSRVFNWIIIIPLVAVAVVAYGTWTAMENSKKRKNVGLEEAQIVSEAPKTPP